MRTVDVGCPARGLSYKDLQKCPGAWFERRGRVLDGEEDLIIFWTVAERADCRDQGGGDLTY